MCQLSKNKAWPTGEENLGLQSEQQQKCDTFVAVDIQSGQQSELRETDPNGQSGSQKQVVVQISPDPGSCSEYCHELTV